MNRLEDYPKVQFDYHAAGQNGIGTASYIDDVILRDKDNSDDWEAAADDTLEEPLYYCQNWRHDVVALIDANGVGDQVEHMRYEAYGVPYLFVAGDVTANGTINATDTNQIQTWIDTSAYDARGDLDLDNDVDATDKSLASTNSGKGGGREKLSTHTGNRKGYAGYEFDDSISHMSYHVRHRVLNSTLGQWQVRHPRGPSRNLYLYTFEFMLGPKSPPPINLATTPNLVGFRLDSIGRIIDVIQRSVGTPSECVTGWILHFPNLNPWELPDDDPGPSPPSIFPDAPIYIPLIGIECSNECSRHCVGCTRVIENPEPGVTADYYAWCGCGDCVFGPWLWE